MKSCQKEAQAKKNENISSQHSIKIAVPITVVSGTERYWSETWWIENTIKVKNKALGKCCTALI